MDILIHNKKKVSAFCIAPTFYHRYFITDIISPALYHRHFITDIISSTLYHRYFIIDIISPTFYIHFNFGIKFVRFNFSLQGSILYLIIVLLAAFGLVKICSSKQLNYDFWRVTNVLFRLLLHGRSTPLVVSDHDDGGVCESKQQYF